MAKTHKFEADNTDWTLCGKHAGRVKVQSLFDHDDIDCKVCLKAIANGRTVARQSYYDMRGYYPTRSQYYCPNEHLFGCDEYDCPFDDPTYFWAYHLPLLADSIRKEDCAERRSLCKCCECS